MDAASIASANNIKQNHHVTGGPRADYSRSYAGPTNPRRTEATTAPATSPATTAPPRSSNHNPHTAATNAPTAVPTGGPVIHTVQSGDMLGSLAVKYGVDVE